MSDTSDQPPYLDDISDLRERVRELEEALRQSNAELEAARIEYSKCDNGLREKDRAMGVLFARLSKAGVDCSDLIS